MDKSSNSNFFDRISVEMGFDRFSLDMEEPDSHLHFLDGKIIYHYDDEEDGDGKEKAIGAFRLTYIDSYSALDRGISLCEVCDSDGDAYEFYEGAINFKNDEFNSKTKKVLGDEIGDYGNVLIIDRIGICPEYRGRHLGLAVLRNLIQRFSLGANVVAIKPSPFEFTSEHIKQNQIDWHNCDNENSVEAKSLSKYYQKLGFKKIPKSAYLVLSTALKLPEI